MKMQVPLGKPQPWVLPMTFVCLALGALIASMLRLASAPTEIDPNARPEELVATIRNQQSENLAMKEQILQLRAEKDKLLDLQTNDKRASNILKKELDSLRIRAGTTAVEGRGIVITIDDTKNNQPDLANLGEVTLTHDVDLMMLVNELRVARAEAISINDLRIVFSTGIRCAGPVINVNDTPVAPPFVIKAIGDPDTLAGAVNQPHGVVDQLKLLGIQVSVVKRDKLHLPPISVLPPFKESRVVSSKESNTYEP